MTSWTWHFLILILQTHHFLNLTLWTQHFLKSTLSHHNTTNFLKLCTWSKLTISGLSIWIDSKNQQFCLVYHLWQITNFQMHVVYIWCIIAHSNQNLDNAFFVFFFNLIGSYIIFLLSFMLCWNLPFLTCYFSSVKYLYLFVYIYYA